MSRNPPIPGAGEDVMNHPTRAVIARPLTPFTGTARVPGDKSISHRTLILGALTVGETTVEGLLEGEDVLATASAIRLLGAHVERDACGVWRINGCGISGLKEADDVLDLGNAGTGVRLLCGVAAGHPFTTFLCGDRSLSRRPMGRVIEPLEEMGARFLGRSGGRLPLAVTGGDPLLPLHHELRVPSAQVKSAVLLAGLHAPGTTTVVEKAPLRDHTERLLHAFGASLEIMPGVNGQRSISIAGHPELVPVDIHVPGDPSSAAFLIGLGAALPGAALTVRHVGINPTRTGFFETLRDMGANLGFINRREMAGEPVADITVEGTVLKGIEVPPERAPSMIDEYPVLAAIAATAEGRTVMRGLAELRVKESDRLAAVAAGLAANGVRVDEERDGLVVHGVAGRPPGGGCVAVNLDHRIAMAFLVMGLLSHDGVAIDDTGAIDTSFPGFTRLLEGLGAEFGAWTG